MITEQCGTVAVTTNSMTMETKAVTKVDGLTGKADGHTCLLSP